MYEAIPGYEEAKHFLPVGFKPFEHIALRRMLDRFDETGGELVMYIPRLPTAAPLGLTSGRPCWPGGSRPRG